MDKLEGSPSDGMLNISEAQLRRIRQSGGLRTVEHFSDLDSTNNRALQLSGLEEVELPALILTDRQTAGRGRGSHTWWDAPGALTFSLILPRSVHEPSQRAGCIALAAGVAVCEVAQQLCPGSPVGMKWPNDVEIAGRKLCGILVEVPRHRHRCVLGIGLNVNNSLHDAPPPLPSQAISLRDATGKPHPLDEVLAAIIAQVQCHLEWLDRDDPRLIDRWQTRSVLKGNCVRVDAGRQSTEGICEGVGRDGALLVRNQDGLHHCVSGTVVRLS